MTAGCRLMTMMYYFLEQLENAFSGSKKQSLLLADVFKKDIEDGIVELRKVASVAIQNGLPIPAMLSGLTYFDSMTSEFLSANMIQAQRDFFGAHTYQKEIGGEFFHHDWN